MSRSGVLTDLEPSPDGAAAVVPTFTPAQFERAMNTRAAASSMERRQRTMTVRTPPILQDAHTRSVYMQPGHLRGHAVAA